MPALRIDGGKSTLELLPNGVLHLAWEKHCTITAKDAEAAMVAGNALAEDHEHPMLVDMETTKSVARDARAVFSIPSAASRIALLGSSPVDRMIANFFLNVNRPPCPTQFFTSRHLAMAWLEAGTDEPRPTTDASQLPSSRGAQPRPSS